MLCLILSHTLPDAARPDAQREGGGGGMLDKSTGFPWSSASMTMSNCCKYKSADEALQKYVSLLSKLLLICSTSTRKT